MALVPNKTDSNYDAEVRRMHKIASGSEGKENIQSEFGIDLTKGDLPKADSGTKPVKAKEEVPVKSK